jgi:hypothetical protein
MAATFIRLIDVDKKNNTLAMLKINGKTDIYPVILIEDIPDNSYIKYVKSGGKFYCKLSHNNDISVISYLSKEIQTLSRKTEARQIKEYEKINDYLRQIFSQSLSNDCILIILLIFMLILFVICSIILTCILTSSWKV